MQKCSHTALTVNGDVWVPVVRQESQQLPAVQTGSAPRALVTITAAGGSTGSGCEGEYYTHCRRNIWLGFLIGHAYRA